MVSGQNTKIIAKVFGILLLIALGIFGVAWLMIFINNPNDKEERDSTITINGNDDWAILAANNLWCDGSGNLTDPYVIENITIEIKGEWANCLEISNTDVFFIVKNSYFFQGSCCYPYWCFCGVRYGIKLENVINGQFINNTLYLHDYGIHAKSCRNLTISNNTFIQNHYGIQFFSCFNNLVVGNCFDNKFSDYLLGIGYGIWEATSSFNNTFLKNNITYAGIYISNRSNYRDPSNLLNGKSIYIYRNLSNLIPENFSNAGYIILENCINVSVNSIELQTTYRGLWLQNCVNVSITNSSLNCVDSPIAINSINVSISNSEFNHSSPSFENSTGSTISYNSLFSSSIYLRSCDCNIISHNLLNQTQTAIYLEEGSDNNLITKNTIFYFYNCFYNSSDCVGNQWINNICTLI